MWTTTTASPTGALRRRGFTLPSGTKVDRARGNLGSGKTRGVSSLEYLSGMAMKGIKMAAQTAGF